MVHQEQSEMTHTHTHTAEHNQARKRVTPLYPPFSPLVCFSPLVLTPPSPASPTVMPAHLSGQKRLLFCHFKQI